MVSGYFKETEMKKPKSKCCNAEIKAETGWIEHPGLNGQMIGHPGGIIFSCSKCGKQLDFWESQKMMEFYYNQSQTSKSTN